ncbi:MAG TPA: TldD/PmbA family protein [Candidatus Brocadiia bacterium]|nr:TldD/PmbA family protein [Candidatus Brocadiales bacterium]
MITTEQLRTCVSEGLERIKKIKNVVEAEVFASWNEQIVNRLNYTSDIPCQGVQEPKSIQFYGVGVLAAFKSGNKIKVGFGSEPNDLSVRGVLEALKKARMNKISDPDYKSLPEPQGTPTLTNYHDVNVMEISDEKVVNLGWQALQGTLSSYSAKGFSKSLIVGGDVTIFKERMAIRNTRGIDDFDETSILTATITSMIEDEGVKGTGWNTATHLDKFKPEEAGKEAAESAIRTIGGQRIASGAYDVIFGRQPVTDLVGNLIAPSLSLISVNASDTPFLRKLGQRVCSPNITVYDDGAMPGQIGSKRITCEGIPTGRTDLITDGIITGFLTNDYYNKKLQSNLASFTPRNGFRFSLGGRNYNMQTKVSPTNVVIEGREEIPDKELLSLVKEGIYIGRIWYTYPVNGLAVGDFTSTIVADSYLIKDGKLLAPLKPNAVRINSNINHVLNNIIGITKEKKATLVWGGEEVVVAPEIAVKGVRLDSIANESTSFES